MRYDFKLTGIRPLLLHADNIEWSDVLKDWLKTPEAKDTAAGDDRAPAWRWLGSLYHDGKQLTVPVENFQACLLMAGSRVKIKGNATYKELAVSGLLVGPESLPLGVGPQKKPVAWEPVQKLSRNNSYKEHIQAARGLGFELFAKPVKIRNGAKLVRHLRVRPMFRDWQLAGTVEIMDERISPKALADIFAMAGRIGLGDWRPGVKSGMTPGQYGMFKAELKPTKD